MEVEAAARAASGERADDEHEEKEGDVETTDYGGSDHSNDDTTTDGGSKATAEKKAKRPRKDRTPQVLANITDEFTFVSPSVLPLEPADKASGYSMQLGYIVRDTI